MQHVIPECYKEPNVIREQSWRLRCSTVSLMTPPPPSSSLSLPLSFPGTFLLVSSFGSLMALFHCMVRFGTARYGTAQLGSVAFPPQFSTAIEWAGLFTRRYNCAASTAVTSS